MTVRAAFTLSLFAAVACGDKDDTGDSVAEEAFTPTEGHWSLLSQVVASDECGLLTQEGDTADTAEEALSGFTLTMNSEATFTINQDDPESENQACSLDQAAQSFTCAPTELVSDAGGASRDALVVYTQTASGQFSGAGEVEIRVDFDVRCDGDDCGEIEAFLGVSFPCDALLEMSASAD